MFSWLNYWRANVDNTMIEDSSPKKLPDGSLDNTWTHISQWWTVFALKHKSEVPSSAKSVNKATTTKLTDATAKWISMQTAGPSILLKRDFEASSNYNYWSQEFMNYTAVKRQQFAQTTFIALTGDNWTSGNKCNSTANWWLMATALIGFRCGGNRGKMFCWSCKGVGDNKQGHSHSGYTHSLEFNSRSDKNGSNTTKTQRWHSRSTT